MRLGPRPWVALAVLLGSSPAAGGTLTAMMFGPRPWPWLGLAVLLGPSPSAAGPPSAEPGDGPLVAVLEHAPEQGPSPRATIRRNLAVYDREARRAAAQGARLLVTPESGLTGSPAGDRAALLAYAADLPPAPRPPPCEGRGAAGVPPLLRSLSCLARARAIALVANLIDVKNCSREPLYPGCSSSRDGLLFFNTDIVLDGDGTYLARYHKANLWGEEQLDAAVDCQAATFSPRSLNVTFGLFTCADLLHSWPALRLVRDGVRHFTMPLSWSDEMAQMQPLGWLQAWSQVANATLLAANGRRRGLETGSGIFSRGRAVIYTYQPFTDRPTSLLVAPLPQLPPWPPSPWIYGPPAAEAGGAPAEPASRAAPEPLGASGAQGLPPPAWSVERLDMAPGAARAARVCSRRDPGTGSVCCALTYTPERAGRGFVLAAFSGQDGEPGVQPSAAQACAVLPCARAGSHCLRYRAQAMRAPASFGIFASLELWGNLSSDSTLFPVVLTWPNRLRRLGPSVDVDPASHQLRLSFSRRAGEQLVSLEMYGRLFDKDSPQPTCRRRDGKQVASPRAARLRTRHSLKAGGFPTPRVSQDPPEVVLFE